MLARRVLTAVAFGAALFVVSGCGTTNPVSSTNSSLDSTPPAAPQNLKSSLGDGGALVLSWDASADADVQGYDVYRYAPDPSRESAYVKINGALVTGTQYIVSDATDSESYYRVKAVDRSANVSASSSDVAAAGVSPIGAGTDVGGDPGMKHSGR